MKMKNKKFVDLSQDEQVVHVTSCFTLRDGHGWYGADGEFAGASVEDVIGALIDFEDAEINAIGDCMTGYCLTQPRLSDFVRKS